MANIPISALPPASTLTGTELSPVVQSGATKRTTMSAIRTFINAATLGSATPQALGTASAGVATNASREDHVHLLPTLSTLGAGALASLNTVGSAQIDNGSVANIDLANMGANTVKGAVSAGAPIDLTGAQVAAIIGNFTSANAGVVPASGGGTTTFLRADGTFATIPSSGTNPKGPWNASTNTPTLVSSVGTNGDYYDVTVAGSTTLNGISSWVVGDRVQFTTTGNVWFKIPTTASVTSVAGKSGAVTLVAADISDSTSVGRTLFTAANLAAQQSALGLAPLAFKTTVATGDIDNQAVTFVKMQNVATATLLGRASSGTGSPEAVTLNATMEFSAGALQRAALTGDVTASAGSNALAIANDAVTNAKLANMATQTFKGRTTGGTGDPEDLTVAQATAMLNVATTSLKGLVPAPTAANGFFLFDDLSWKDTGVRYAVSYGVGPSRTAAQNVTGFALIAAAGPGVYLFPPGTIDVNASVSMGANQRWVGAERGATIIRATASLSVGIINNASVSGLHISDLTLNGNSQTSTNGLINWNTISDFTVNNVNVINYDVAGIGLNACSSGVISNFNINRVATSSTQNQAILISSASGASQYLTIRDGICRNSGINYEMRDSALVNVQVYTFGFGAGITSEQSSANCLRNKVIGCLATGGTGVDVNGYRCGGAELWDPFTEVIGFTSFANAGQGIDFGCRHGVLADSIFYNNGVGLTTFDGIRMRYGDATFNASYSVISGNRGHDTNIASGTQAYGYSEESASLQGIRLDGNNFEDNRTGAMNILSTTTRVNGALRGTNAFGGGTINANAYDANTITVTGARVGDSVAVSAEYDIKDLTYTGRVTASNSVRIIRANGTGANQTLGAGNERVYVYSRDG